MLTEYQRRSPAATRPSGPVQSSVKLAWFDVTVTGEEIWIASQKVPVVPAAPSVHVSGTLCDPGAREVERQGGGDRTVATGPAIRHRRSTPLVIVPLKVNVAGQSPPV